MAKKRGSRRESRPPTNLNGAIVNILKESGEMSTKVLAAAVGVAHGTVYRRCVSLEEKGVLRSALKHATGPMYCIDDYKVVTRAEYDECNNAGHDLRPIEGVARFWSVP